MAFLFGRFGQFSLARAPLKGYIIEVVLKVLLSLKFLFIILL